MKKVKLSLAALVLIIAIAGTATANANADQLEPCKTFDPKEQICLGGSDLECCEDGGGIRNYP
jgi:hypothetical protein